MVKYIIFLWTMLTSQDRPHQDKPAYPVKSIKTADTTLDRYDAYINMNENNISLPALAGKLQLVCNRPIVIMDRTGSLKFPVLSINVERMTVMEILTFMTEQCGQLKCCVGPESVYLSVGPDNIPPEQPIKRVTFH